MVVAILQRNHLSLSSLLMLLTPFSAFFSYLFASSPMHLHVLSCDAQHNMYAAQTRIDYWATFIISSIFLFAAAASNVKSALVPINSSAPNTEIDHSRRSTGDERCYFTTLRRALLHWVSRPLRRRDSLYFSTANGVMNSNKSQIPQRVGEAQSVLKTSLFRALSNPLNLDLLVCKNWFSELNDGLWSEAYQQLIKHFVFLFVGGRN